MDRKPLQAVATMKVKKLNQIRGMVSMLKTVTFFAAFSLLGLLGLTENVTKSREQIHYFLCMKKKNLCRFFLVVTSVNWRIFFC